MIFDVAINYKFQSLRAAKFWINWNLEDSPTEHLEDL